MGWSGHDDGMMGRTKDRREGVIILSQLMDTDDIEFHKRM